MTLGEALPGIPSLCAAQKLMCVQRCPSAHSAWHPHLQRYTIASAFLPAATASP